MPVVRLLLSTLLAAAILIGPIRAHAVILFLDPAGASVTTGSSVAFQVRVGDLGSSVPPSLSAFDLLLGFDPTFLSATSVLFGDPSLGNQLDFGSGSLQSTDLSIAGQVSFSEFSFEFPAALDANQADSFVLATVMFDALIPTPIGNPTLVSILNTPAFPVPLLSDAFGNAITSVVPGPPSEVTIRARPTTAAEPSVLALLTPPVLALGIAGFVRQRRSRVSR